jgi:hypothetical protein
MVRGRKQSGRVSVGALFPFAAGQALTVGDDDLVTRLIRNGAIVLAALGLWTSLHYAFAAWTIDSDNADAAMVWLGWQRDGLPFVTGWTYTQDNWLLTVIALSFAAFAVLGPQPWVVLAIGWLMFAGSCAMTALIARRFVSPLAGWVLLALFLLSGMFAVGRGGDMSMALEHTSSMLGGLVALYAWLVWLERGRVWTLAAGAVVALATALSDPWTLAAFLAPMGVVAVGLIALTPRAGRLRLVVLAGTVLVVALLARTKLLGVFGFLPATSYELSGLGWIDDRFAWTATVVAQLFDIYPGVSQVRVMTTALSCAVLAWLCGHAVLALGRARASLSGPARFLAGVAVVSPAAVVAAYLLGPISEQRLELGRFFPNVYFLLPLLIALAFERARLPGVVRVVAVVCAGLMMAAGLASQPSAWLRGMPVVHSEGTDDLIAFLSAHGLHYGFGAYFGTQANAVTWLSGGAVTIRPIAFDETTGRISRRRDQTSPLWYTDGDAPGDVDRMFIAIGPGEENCFNPALCLAGVTAQFGTPDETLHDGTLDVLVYRRRIAVR